ncbi:MAG: aldolase/citrate lyase family protein [Chloroflexota bacterium]|nr:aldolase/citrate lyase family protein [Chloroflexota bacterium]
MNGAQLRETMHNGGTIYGTMTSFVRNPRWASVYGRLGFDYIIVDTEHSPTGRSEAADLAAAFLGAGICPVIRVPHSEPHAAIMALDAGFHGVLVPYCETPEEVKAVVHAARLRPLKGALHDRVRDAGEFPSEATQRYLEGRNADVVVIIGIESVPAVENLERILDVGGIDAIFIGPNDLSITMGIPDEYTHPRFVETVEHIINTAQRRGIPGGAHWQTEEQVDFWQARGSRFILYSSDARALTEGYRAALNKFRGGTVGQMRHTL